MGLLDALSSDDAKLGLGLLAAGGYSPTPMSTGQRLQMAMQGVSADKQNALKLKLLQSQIDENASQNALRQAQLGQQQKRDAYFMGDGGMGGTPAAGAAAVPGASAGVGGLPGSPSGAAPVAGGDRFSQWSAQYGIPRDAFVTAYMTEGGKGIADMLMKRGTSDMQVSGNYAYDKNKLQPGFLPSLNISQDGKSSLVQIGPDGLPVVSAPRGALPTFNAYQGAANRSAADYQPETVVDTNPGPTFGQKVVRPRSQVLQPQAAAPSNAMIDASLGSMPAPQAGVTGNFTGSYEQVRRAVADIKDPQERSNALAALDKQFGVAQPSAGNVVELSPAEQTGIAANKDYQTGVAKDQVEQRKSIMTAGFSAPSKIAKLQQIDKLLGDFEGGKLSQTGVDFASAMNSLGLKVDKNLPNKEAAQSMSREIALSLRNPAGGAGMPGALSDSDRNFLSSMTPDIGQTAAGRKQIIGAGVAVEQRNQQVADFARKYEAKYGKLDNGFYSQLSAWSNANPLFGK